MAQLLLDNQDSIENEETFIAETARLAELVVKQVALKSECCKPTVSSVNLCYYVIP